MKEKKNVIPTELYTTEGRESAERAEAELKAKPPEDAEAKRRLEELLKASEASHETPQ